MYISSTRVHRKRSRGAACSAHTCVCHPFGPPRNVKPPKRYVGLKPHRRRSSGSPPAAPSSSFSLRPSVFFILPLSARPHPVTVYAIHGDRRGHCSHRLNAFGKHCQRRCANGSLFTLRILSPACVRACVTCRVCVSRSKTALSMSKISMGSRTEGTRPYSRTKRAA